MLWRQAQINSTCIDRIFQVPLIVFFWSLSLSGKLWEYIEYTYQAWKTVTNTRRTAQCHPIQCNFSVILSSRAASGETPFAKCIRCRRFNAKGDFNHKHPFDIFRWWMPSGRTVFAHRLFCHCHEIKTQTTPTTMPTPMDAKSLHVFDIEFRLRCKGRLKTTDDVSRKRINWVNVDGLMSRSVCASTLCIGASKPTNYFCYYYNARYSEFNSIQKSKMTAIKSVKCTKAKSKHPVEHGILCVCALCSLRTHTHRAIFHLKYTTCQQMFSLWNVHIVHSPQFLTADAEPTEWQSAQRDDHNRCFCLAPVFTPDGIVSILLFMPSDERRTGSRENCCMQVSLRAVSSVYSLIPKRHTAHTNMSSVRQL